MKNKITFEWFERGKRDFETAELIFNHRGHYNEVIFLLHQAIEKYLRGYLVLYNWKLRKIHDIETLLVEAEKYNKSFVKFIDFGRKLTAFYYDDRYPPGPPSEVTKEEAGEMLNHAKEIINMITEGT